MRGEDGAGASLATRGYSALGMVDRACEQTPIAVALPSVMQRGSEPKRAGKLARGLAQQLLT